MPGSPRARTSPDFDQGGGNGTEARVHGPLRSRVLPGTGPEAASPTQAPEAPPTTPTLPDWYVKAVKDTAAKGTGDSEGSQEVPDWAKDMTDGMGMEEEQQASSATKAKTKATGEPVPEWVKDTLDDPTLKATVAAGRAQQTADALATHEGQPAPLPAPQGARAQETTHTGESAPLPTPAPPPAAPPPVPDWAKAGGSTATGASSGVTSSVAGKGNGTPPPVPGWAKDFVADS